MKKPDGLKTYSLMFLIAICTIWVAAGFLTTTGGPFITAAMLGPVIYYIYNSNRI